MGVCVWMVSCVDWNRVLVVGEVVDECEWFMCGISGCTVGMEIVVGDGQEELYWGKLWCIVDCFQDWYVMLVCVC